MTNLNNVNKETLELAAQAVTYIETWDINDISDFYGKVLGYETKEAVIEAYELHKTAFKKLTKQGYLIEEMKTIAKMDIQDCELVKPVKARKVETIIKAIRKLEAKANLLHTYIEYPFKSGHMECVNRTTDTWQPTRKHNNMVDTVNRNCDNLYNELEEVICGKSYTEEEAYNMLIKGGLCGDEIVYILEEWDL